MIITRGQLTWRIENLKEVIASYVYSKVYEKAKEIDDEEVQNAIKTLKVKHEAGILREKTVSSQKCFNHLCESALRSALHCMIRGLYHYFDHYNHNVQRAFNEFTMDNFKCYGFNKAVDNIRRSLADENNMKTAHVRYWNFQIRFISAG